MNPPVFAHGHLRLYLLSVLAEQPMHGYDLIQALGNRFGGTYVPSAGTIYPRLGKLEEEGLVTKTVDGRKTIYEITDAGRAELLERESELDGIENDVTDSVRRLADEVRSSVNDAMRTLRADLASAAREARTEAKAEGRSVRVDEGADRVLGRLQLQQAEIIINDFRSQIRSELRSQLSAGKVTGVTVELLRVQLDSVKDSLRASFQD
jgi:DNA-binding PadR family transcriptional regulator